MNFQKMQDGFIYSGNRHESVPRALFFDKRLTPLERNAWQIIRLCLDDRVGNTTPTYDYLQQFLTSMPCTEKASTETVARALITRWLSVIKRRAKDGTKQSNIYILHDSPLIVFEAMSIDDDYLTLVCNSMSHASKAIQLVTTEVLNDIVNDPFLKNKQLPTRLELLLNRTLAQNTAQNLSTVHKSEGSENNLLRNQEKPVLESEVGFNQLKNNKYTNPKSALSSSNINKILLLNNLPERFYSLSSAQQSGILKIMQKLTIDERQLVIKEWDDRCNSQKINSPAAYLYGIAQKAVRGELNELLLIKKSTQQPEQQNSNSTDDKRVSKEMPDKQKVQTYINDLKQLVAMNR